MLSYRIPSAPSSLSLSAGSQPRPALLAWAAELCAKSACDWFAYSWQVENCFFSYFIFFYFIPLLVATRYLCVFDAILVVCREASLASTSLLLCVYSHFVCSLCAAPFEQLFDYFHSICSFWVCRSQQVASTLVALAIFKKYKQRSKKNNIKNMNTK